MKRTILIGFSLALATAASAQKPDPFDVRVVDINILQSQKVQGELGITLKMREKMNSFAADHGAKATKVMEAAQKKGQEPTNPEVVKKSFALYNELKSNIVGLLSASQVRRWRELTIQSAGLPALLDEAVGNRIGLKDAQKSKLKAAYTAGAKKYEALQKEMMAPIAKKYNGITPKSEAEAKSLKEKVDKEANAAQAVFAPRFRKAQSETEAGMKAALTKPQFAAFEALKGKAFKPG